MSLPHGGLNKTQPCPGVSEGDTTLPWEVWGGTWPHPSVTERETAASWESEGTALPVLL